MKIIQKLAVPFAIIVAGGLIALAIYYTNTNPAGTKTAGNVADIAKNANAPQTEVAPITSADHLLGSKDAQVTIIDYSDTECPFCKRFHNTLKQIFAEYGASGKVAWVYRHFPLDFHKKAPKEAEATECAAELGGNKVFWDYIGLIYETTTSNDSLDPAMLYTLAPKAGLDKAAFTKCLDSGKYAAKISEAKNAGLKAGARGTPYTVLIVKKGSKTETIPLVDDNGQGLGALPYTSLKAIVDSFLK